MERQTFEGALHLWDEWHDSINKSRELLGYDPKWPKGKSISWIEEHYSDIRNQAEAVLRKLDLPPSLREYWEDCFYSDYRTEAGQVDYNKITRRLSDRKSLPALPCDYGVVWYEDEDTHDPWLRVEIRIHARFATKELFNYATRYAYDSVKSYLEREQAKEHPVCQWLKGGRPHADEGVALECVRLKDDEKLTHKEIGQHFGWALQKDSYGNLNQCSTSRRYVKLGRRLRKEYQS